MRTRPSRILGAVALVALVVACSNDDGRSPTTTAARPAAAPGGSTPTVPGGPEPARFEAVVEVLTAADLPASWRPGCPVAVEDLRLVRAPHWGFDDEVHDGELVVASDLADTVVAVLRELFDARYPIEQMVRIDRYGGSDDESMAANNTSAFNCRRATGGSSWSEHAYGRAVDVNPLQNPYVRGDVVLPPQSARYTDRSLRAQGVIHEDDALVRAFDRHGWVWGGRWSTLKDYQHFSPSGR